MSYSLLTQIISACIGIIGSLFFAIGVMRQTIEAMARLSGTNWNWNPHLPTTLAAQKADYLFGGGLIFLAFACQFLSFFLSSKPILTSSQSVNVPWIAVGVTVIGFFILRVSSHRLAKHFEIKITKWLKERGGESLAD